MQWIVRTSALALALAGGALPFLPQLGLGSSLIPVKPFKVIDELDPQALYPKSSVEHYLTEKDFVFIRPGLNFQVDNITIPPDRHPVVDLSLYDDLWRPLDRLGIDTPGEITVSFIISVYDPETREHHAYTTRPQTSPITGVTEIQASTDSGGTIEDMGIGKLRYHFGTQLPANFNPTMTHVVAIYGRRTIELDYFTKDYVANTVVPFRPDGGRLVNVWSAVATETCNRCHYDLALHGGQRKEVALCVNCHQSQSVDPDTGNTVDFKVMIHKIHRGANLPSVQAGTPYQIIGFRQSVHDYSTVEFPQDIRNCTTCHKTDMPGGDVWLRFPSRKACGSCHEDVNFATGEGHPGGAQADDASCKLCHQPQGSREFDASIMGAHTIPTESETLAGLNAEFLSITDTGPGQTPTVTFRLFNDDGTAVDPASLDRLILALYWPTTNIDNEIRETVDVSRVMVSGDELIYTFATPLPAGASGSGTISIEFRRLATVNGEEIREAGFNSTLDFAITDPMVVPRRAIVAQEKCHACHKKLSLHGGNRFSVKYCVSCHTWDRTDEEVRPEEELPPQGIHFKWLVHNIHTGEDLQRDFTVFGFRGSRHEFNEVRFPGLRNVCTTCHLDGSYLLPLADNLLPTLTPRDFFSPMPPVTAACLGCHSAKAAAAHAYVMSAEFDGQTVEACSTCHGQGRDFDVERVHAH